MRMVTLCTPSSNPDPLRLAFQRLVPDVIAIEMTVWFDPLVTFNRTVLILVNRSRRVRLKIRPPAAALGERLLLSMGLSFVSGLFCAVRIGPLRSTVMVTFADLF